jgi:hypothetical protein
LLELPLVSGPEARRDHFIVMRWLQALGAATFPRLAYNLMVNGASGYYL